MSIPLVVNVRTSGLYFLRANRFLNIPSTIYIRCKDNYFKDSLDLRTGDYHFKIDNADTNSFGKRRKAATNVPGLKPVRQSGMFIYGAVFMLGFNNINIGYGLGRDNLFGFSGNYWVYQDKTWQSIIVSLDVLKI